MIFITPILPLLLSLFLFQYALVLEAQPESDFSRSVVQIRSPDNDHGIGVGFIVKIDQNKVYLITPQHVIGDSNSVKVIFHDQAANPVEAKILEKAMPGTNTTQIAPVQLDLAVLEINKDSIPESRRESLSSLCLSDKNPSVLSGEVKIIRFLKNKVSVNSTAMIDMGQTNSLEIAFSLSGSLERGHSGSILVIDEDNKKQVLGMFIGDDSGYKALPAELIWRYLNDKTKVKVEACLTCEHPLRSSDKPLNKSRESYFTREDILKDVDNTKKQFAQNVSSDRYQKRNQTTVIDKSSCLMWQYLDISSSKKYQEIGNHLSDLEKTTSYHDWRLPTIAELSSLLISPSSVLHINNNLYGEDNSIWKYWSSDKVNSNEVWVINFSGNPSEVVPISIQRDEKDIGIMAVRSIGQ